MERAAERGPAMSIRAIASAQGVSPTTVLKIIQSQDDYRTADDGTITVGRTLGLDGKIRPSRRVDTTERDLTIVAMRDAGGSIREIAGKVGCSVGTVHRVISRTR